MSKYRSKHEFQVTVHEPCPMCTQMRLASDLKKREKYIYLAGWLTHERGCQQCFDQALADHQAKADTIQKSNGSGYSYEYGD